MRDLHPEMARILALSKAPFPDVGAFPDVGPISLRTVQIEALGEWVAALRIEDGDWGPHGLAVLAGVGHGKTLISLLLPHVHAAVLGWTPKTLYLVPAALRDQLHGDREMWAARGARVPLALEVMSHESLSAPKAKEALRGIAPDLIIIDEAHHFADPASARWRRVADYLKRRPRTRLVIMSGSLSWRSLRQCRHLLLVALRTWCPLPCDASLENWAAALDAGSEPAPGDLRALEPLRRHYDTGRVHGERIGLREAYRERLATCPGVVLTQDAGCTASLSLVAWPGPSDAPEVVRAASVALEAGWVLPDGTELVSSLEYARHAATLPLGFYQRYDPATVAPSYMAARSAWAKVVRDLVTYQGHRYQAPSAVVAVAERGDLPGRAGDVWDTWSSIAAADPPLSETVWLPGAEGAAWAARVVRSWARSSAAPRLVWVQTPALGEALAERLGVRYHGAGSSPPAGDSCIVSSRVHGTGWAGAPVAGYRETLVLEPPSSGATWEQLLGRTHRSGQTEDVTCHVYTPSQRGFAALASALADAKYVEQTQGQRQRLLLADWTGLRPPR